MKKVKYLVALLLGVLIVTGCQGKDQTKTMVCSRTINQEQASMDLSYTVTYTGDYVEKVESIEKVTSTDTSALNSYKEEIEATYKPYANIKYYDTEVTVDGNTLTSKATIDYSKIDYKEFTNIDSANSQIFTSDGKVKLETMESLYEQIGATCTKK